MKSSPPLLSPTISSRTATDGRAVHRAEFRVMGCAAEVEVVGGDDRLLVDAVHRLARLEAVWSRFVVDSDVSRLNAAGGEALEVDPATIELLAAMVDGHASTAGAFDPTLLASVVALGYRSSRHDASMEVEVSPDIAPRGAIDGVAVYRGGDGEPSWARLPVGTAIDAGGIGKGLAADIVTRELLAAGAEGAMVSVGGDARVAGHGPNGGDWHVAVSDGNRIAGLLRLSDGGVATSGTVHHQVDPLTGAAAMPTDGPVRLVQATVVSGSAAWSEVCATLAMVRGSTALDVLEQYGVAVRLQFDDGTVVVSSRWQLFAAGTEEDAR